MCVGFTGKMTLSSNTKFKLKVNDVVEVMGNKGIKLIKPIKINLEEYVGREWNLEKFNKPKVFTPETHLLYTSSKGETLIRFTDYNYTSQRKLDDNETESTIDVEQELMNVEILQEGYEIHQAIEEAQRLYEEHKYITFKCKGCKQRNMNITQYIKYFKNCLERDYNLGYRTEKVDSIYETS